MSEATLATRLENVSVVISGRQVLGPITWSVNVGEQWAVLGPNGSGKTTLLSLLGGELHPSSGKATVLGEELGRTDVRELRRRIGVSGHRIADRIPATARAVDVVLTGREALLDARWRKFDRADFDRAIAILDHLDCEHLALQPFFQCSQGERQRVLLARSLYGEHELFLLDEPAVGVDFSGRELLNKVLDSLSRKRTITTVCAVQTLEELPASTTHTVLLREGRLIAAGVIEETLTAALLQKCFGVKIVVSPPRFGRIARTAE